jgi:hypothetical protein
MALNYLTIQGLSTPVECVWSSAASTNVKKHNKLLLPRLKALQFIKASYQKQRENKLTLEEKAKLQEECLQKIDKDGWQDDIFEDVEISGILEDMMSNDDDDFSQRRKGKERALVDSVF